MILSKLSKLPAPFQNTNEWRTYLEFVSAYFQNRDITVPTVVEIGVYKNQQKAHYQTFLNARHIGIDINPDFHPDICGDSSDPATLTRLKTMLGGDPIDLLFIDGDHNYSSVRRDYELYSPLVNHITALHDIAYPGPKDLWKIISGTDPKKTYITILSGSGLPEPGHPLMGIGLVINT
jgi:hypothetical protein